MKRMAPVSAGILIIMFGVLPALGQTVTLDKSQKYIRVNDDLVVFSDTRLDVNYKNTPIGYLLTWLNDEDRYTQASVIEKAAKDLAEVVPLLVYVAHPNTALTESKLDGQFRRSALKSLEEIIERGVPTLIELLKKDQVFEVSRAAAEALKSIRLVSMANLSFGESEKRINELISQALNELRKSEDEYKNALLRQLKSPDPSSRERAVLLLVYKFPEMAEELVPELIKLVQNSVEKYTQLEAIKSLGKIGLKAKASIPVLTEAKKHADKSVRQAASAALDKINTAIKKFEKASSSN